jgi:hypothetical protein
VLLHRSGDGSSLDGAGFQLLEPDFKVMQDFQAEHR